MASSRWNRIVGDILSLEPEEEVEQLLVSGALVVRDGEHYRIEAGDETTDELEAIARRQSGLCDCGSPLSSRGSVKRCRTCGREFEAS